MRPWHSSGNPFQISLSSKEILKISNEITKVFAPKEPVRPLSCSDEFPISTSELLEISQDISSYYAPKALSLPKSLVLQTVDPQHLYVFGSFDAYQVNADTQNNAEIEWTLKIHSQSENEEQELVIEQTIHTPQFQQIISLPKPETASVYSASLSKNNSKKDFDPFLHSNNTSVVRKNTDPEFYESHEIVDDKIPSIESFERRDVDNFLDDKRMIEKKHIKKSQNFHPQFSGSGKNNRSL